MRPPKKPADVRMCALYGRVSTDRQARVQDGGLDTQFALMQKRVEYQNSLAPNSSWTIHDRYREEGKSGKNLDRPEFQRTLIDLNLTERTRS